MVRRRLVLVAMLAVVLASVYAVWLRNSFLVAVDELRVKGATVQYEEIETALGGAVSHMTTLNVDEGALTDAVARFPTVRTLSVETDFPNGLTVTVHERAPVATIESAGRQIAVSGDARILEGLAASDLGLPQLESDEPPASGVLEGDAREQALVLGAAPEPLAELARRSRAGDDGVTVELRGGVEILFGTARRAERKWEAAAAVLADPELESVGWVDVRVPGRPAVGGTVSSEHEAAPEPPTEAAVPPEGADVAAETEAAPQESGATPAPPPADPAGGAEPAAAEPAPAPATAPETGAVTP